MVLNDANKRQSLIDHCHQFADKHDGQLLAVSIEVFFDGNGDLGSMMCNLTPASIEDVRNQFLKIRRQPSVEAVLIQLHETMEEDIDSWPFAKTALAYTSVAPDEVRSWFDPELAPDETGELDREIEGISAAKPGIDIIQAWWD